jgi:hypothetical protein
MNGVIITTKIKKKKKFGVGGGVFKAKFTCNLVKNCICDKFSNST